MDWLNQSKFLKSGGFDRELDENQELHTKGQTFRFMKHEASTVGLRTFAVSEIHSQSFA